MNFIKEFLMCFIFETHTYIKEEDSLGIVRCKFCRHIIDWDGRVK